MKVVLTFELLELDLPAQTPYPTANIIPLFAHVFQFSFSYFQLHPLKSFGAKPFPRPLLLWGHEEQGQPASAALSLTLAGRQTSRPWVCPFCPPHTWKLFSPWWQLDREEVIPVPFTSYCAKALVSSDL